MHCGQRPVAGSPHTSQGMIGGLFLANSWIVLPFISTSRSEITFGSSSVVEPKSYSYEHVCPGLSTCSRRTCILGQRMINTYWHSGVAARAFWFTRIASFSSSTPHSAVCICIFRKIAHRGIIKVEILHNSTVQNSFTPKFSKKLRNVGYCIFPSVADRHAHLELQSTTLENRLDLADMVPICRGWNHVQKFPYKTYRLVLASIRWLQSNPS